MRREDEDKAREDGECRDGEAGGGWLLKGVNNTEKSRKIRHF